MALRRLSNNENASDAEIKSLIRGIRCWLLDMDGTVTIGEELIPGAAKFFEALGDNRYIFATNNSSHSAQHYLNRLKRLGIKADRDYLITSTDALVKHIKDLYTSKSDCQRSEKLNVDFEGTSNRGSSWKLSTLQQELQQETNVNFEGTATPINAYVIGTPEFESEITSAGINIINTRDKKIDAVLVGFDTTLTYEKLDAACEYIRAGVPFYAANPDKVCPLAGGKVQADCGAIIAFLETCTDRKVTRVYGKPDPAMIEMILSRYGYKKNELAMVGDRVYTDMAFAKMAGIVGIGVLTGEATLEEIAESDYLPDMVFDRISDIAKYL